jgi:NADH-quinone oxidoreductase subunit A
VAFKDVGAFGFWSMIAFLVVLTVGFIYEWRKGALEWD